MIEFSNRLDGADAKKLPRLNCCRISMTAVAAGNRYAGKLLEYARGLAKMDGCRQIYISTGNIGLYEKYWCAFWKVMKNAKGDDCRVYTVQVG